MAIGGSLGKLIVSIETDLTNFNSGLNNANSRMQKTRGALIQGTQQIGRAFTIMGAVTVGAFAFMAKSAIDFEDAFAGVRKTVDATEEEFIRLSNGLRKMSTEIPIAATELAKIQEIAGQLGIRGVESLEKFTKIVAFIGITTNLTVEAAATDLARIAGIMTEPIKNIDRMGSVIVELGNNSRATEADIVSFANRIAGAGKVAGLTTAEVFAFGAAFASVGVKAERGGTAVSKALIKMGVAVADGGEQLEEFADIAGFTSDEFIKVYKKEGPGKAFALFIEGLGKAGLKGAAILKELELGNQRIVQSFLSVGGATGILTEKLEMASQEWIDNTALLKEAEERFKTTASKIKLLINNIVEIGRRIGDTLLPALRPLIDDLKEIIQNIGEWIKENPKLTESIAKWTLAVGALLLVLGPLLVLLPQIAASITLINVALGIKLIPLLGKIAAVGAAAFIGWKIGERIVDVYGLSDALSGPDGLFTKFLEWWDEKDMKGKFKAIGDEISRLAEQAKILLGIPVAPPEVDLGGITVEGGEAPVIPTPTEEDEESFMGFFARISEAFTTLGNNIKTGWGSAITYAKTQMISFQTLLNNVVVTFQKGFAKAISNVVLGITTAKEAVKQLGLQLISMVIEFFAEWVIHQLLAKALGAALTAFTITTAALVASAWAPAAALASLATLGGNAAPAAAALTSTVALAKVLSIPALAEGGIVTKPTLALIGEAGPEAIVPLDKKSAGNRNVINIVFENVNVANDIDMDEMAEMIGQNVEEKLRGV